MSLLVPVVIAASLAFLGYIVLERLGVQAWLPATCRAVGWAAIALLVLNPSCRIPGAADRPLVLLDASLSMTAAGGRWEEARTAALDAGDVVTFGDPARKTDSLPVAGRSLLAGSLAAAAATGRDLVIVTDGEIDDGATVPQDLLRQSSVRLFPRSAGPSAAIRGVTGPERVLLRDSILLRVEIRVAGLSDGEPSDRPLRLHVLASDRTMAPTTVRVGGTSSTVINMIVPAQALGPGEHLLEVAIVDTIGGEWRDDVRLHHVVVAQTPGIVLVASPPDWETRFLYRTLREVTSLPVEGFAEMEPGRWRRMSDLASVSRERVRAAYRSADVGVRYGTPSGMGLRPRSEWVWPHGPPPATSGDWYVSAGGVSPLSGVLASWSVDSFPPATSVVEDTLPAGAWVGMTARLRRRGTPRPVLFGRETGGRREITSLGRGWWRWAFRGDASEQAYRALVASSVDWLLGEEIQNAAGIGVNQNVVPRGLPLTFSWAARAAGTETRTTIVPVRFRAESDGEIIDDTLRFTADGTASVHLPPGTYRYSFPGANGAPSATGLVAIEAYSAEWFPHPVALSETSALATRPGQRRGTRDSLWPFGLAIAALTIEWGIRRRRGLR